MGGKVPPEMKTIGAQQKDRTIVRTSRERKHLTMAGKRSRVIPPMDWEPKRKTKRPEKKHKRKWKYHPVHPWAITLPGHPEQRESGRANNSLI